MARKRGDRRRRRGRFTFFYKLLTMLVVCGVVVTALTLFFKLGEVRISGNTRYTQEEIRLSSGLEMGENLFLMNKYAVANRLLNALPYIEEVRINRLLPDTMLIDVSECDHTYAVVQGGTAWLMSDSGKIVDSCKPSEAEGSPRIEGCELLAPAVGAQMALSAQLQSRQESLLNLLSALEEAEAVEKVTTISLESPSELVIDYVGRFDAVMPYEADYGYMLTYLERVVSALETNETGTIDLTHEGEAHVLKG